MLLKKISKNHDRFKEKDINTEMVLLLVLVRYDIKESIVVVYTS